MNNTVNYCPLCRHETSHHFDTSQFRGYTVHNRICANCGVVFQSPRMSSAELDEFYATEYRQVYQGEEGPTQKDLQTQAGRAKSLLGFVMNTVPQVVRHLDIGSSAGILLNTFRDHYGNEPVGVEPGDSYRRYAQLEGLNIYSDISDLPTTQQDRFDFISLAHVLEHLANPVGYLTYLRERLFARDGWLLIEVPNLYCHDSFEIAHLVSFSAHTLRETIQKAGFEVVKILAHGQPRSEILPLYLTALACPGQSTGVIQPEKFVAQKRKLGMFRRRVLQKLSPSKAWLN